MTFLSLTYDLRTVGTNYNLVLPISQDSGATISVIWGDENTNNNFNHTYLNTSPQIYTIEIYKESGAITCFDQSYSTSNSAQYLTSCNSFGEIGLTSLNSAFSGCIKLQVVPNSLPITSNITDMSYMFYGANIFNQDISSWDVSNVSNMSSMFKEASVFDQNISSWNVSNVTDMSYMFDFASKFNNGGVSLSWGNKTSNVINMSAMFYYASIFNQDISSWNVSKVTNMASIFNKAYAFNQNISTWDVSNVTDMTAMFFEAYTFNNGGVSLSWGNKTSNVTNMLVMFYYAFAFNQDISSWDVSKVTNMSSMFRDNSEFNQNIGSWNVSNVTDMSSMFMNANSFNQNISNWNVSKVTNMSSMFYYAIAFNQNISNWNVSKVTNMSSMFMNEHAFNQNISSWNVSNVTDMSYMFYFASTFNNGSVSLSWGNKTSNVINMSCMFYYAIAFNQNISNWNVSNVTDMSSMFMNANSFNQNIGSWNVSNVTNMSSIFRSTPFNQNISSWNVSKVTNMSSMFQDNSKFNQNISSWDVSNVTDMSYMFFRASIFNQNISNWNVSNVTDMSYMFQEASVFNQNISSWNVSKVTNMDSMLDNTAMSIQNYNALLNGWLTKPLKNNITLGATGLQYTDINSHDNLTSIYNWTIVGDILKITTIKPNETTHTSSTWSHNDITWTSNSSSSQNAQYLSYQAFYDITVSASQNSWATASGDYDNGIFSGIYSTVVSGVTINGEWLEIDSSMFLKLYSYSFYTRNPLGDPGKNNIPNLPKTYTIAGSADNGNTWERIQDGSFTSNPCPTLNVGSQNTSTYIVTSSETISQNQNNSLTGYSTATNYYTRFRIIVTSMMSVSFVTGGTSDNNSYLYFGWTPNFVTQITPNENTHTSSTWTHNGVTWTEIASSQDTRDSTNGLSYTAFNTSAITSGRNRWVPFNGTTTQLYNKLNSSGLYSGLYNGTYSTLIQNGIGTVAGEWLQIGSNIPLRIIGFSLTNWFDEYLLNGYNAELPNNFYICGSNNNTTWYPIIYISFTANPLNPLSTPIYTIPLGTVTGGTLPNLTYNTYGNGNNSYLYFRMVIQQSLGGSISGIPSDGYMVLGNWAPYFSNIIPTEITNLQNSLNYIYGQPLSTLSGTANVEGTFAFTNPNIILPVGTSLQTVIFTPTYTSLYNLITRNVTINITPATLTVTSNNITNTYNGSIQTNTATISGIIGSDTFTINGYGTGTNVGTYNDNLSLNPNGSTSLSNYTIIYNNSSLTINPVILTIIPNSKTIYYLLNDPIFTYTYTGLLPSDNESLITGTLTTSDSSRNIGSYRINSGLNAGPNYILSYQEAYLTIENPPVSSIGDLFSVVQEQLSNISNNQQIRVFQDSSIPVTTQVSTYINVNQNQPITLTIPTNTSSNIITNQISNIQISNNAKYILANIDTITTTSLNSNPVLFSLYYKALNDSLISVVSVTNPFVINVTLDNINTLNIYKYTSGVYVILKHLFDYNITNIGNNYTISLYSNSYISFVNTITSNNQNNNQKINITLNKLKLGTKYNIISYINVNLLNYKFYSSNPNIAKINISGEIITLKKGTFYIIVTDLQGNILYRMHNFIYVD